MTALCITVYHRVVQPQGIVGRPDREEILRGGVTLPALRDGHVSDESLREVQVADCGRVPPEGVEAADLAEGVPVVDADQSLHERRCQHRVRPLHRYRSRICHDKGDSTRTQRSGRMRCDTFSTTRAMPAVSAGS